MSLLMKACGGRPVALGMARVYRARSTAPAGQEEDEEFRVLDLLKNKPRPARRPIRRADVPPDRTERMALDQDWGAVWPGPRSFQPSAVPLPLRQGYVPRGQAPPGKKANAELMKIPNFLHLTPPVVRRQCEALKQFCTPWPAELNSEQAIEQHYPLEVITTDYCHASPSIRNPLARIVSLRIKLSQLNFNKHAKDKFRRLVGDRYDEATDLVTITADRCPMRGQNLDYVNYLLTALYHESWNVEEWEKDKTEEDMEYYDWDNNQSKKSLVDWHLRSTDNVKELSDEEYRAFDISVIPNGERYRNAVSALKNEAESEETIKEYTTSVRVLLGLPEEK